MKPVYILLGVVFFAVTTIVVTGCATSNPDDISQVPWNQPAGWEGPLPSTINQGR